MLLIIFLEKSPPPQAIKKSLLLIKKRGFRENLVFNTFKIYLYFKYSL